MAKNTTGSRSQNSSTKFETVSAAVRLMEIRERQSLEQMVKELRQNGEIQEGKDYSGGFAERYSK